VYREATTILSVCMIFESSRGSSSSGRSEVVVVVVAAAAAVGETANRDAKLSILNDIQVE